MVIAGGGIGGGAAGAAMHGVEIDSGSTAILSITSFDGTSSVTMPTEVTLPSGSLTAKVQGLVGDLDVSDLAIDRDREKITAAGVANLTLQ